MRGKLTDRTRAGKKKCGIGAENSRYLSGLLPATHEPLDAARLTGRDGAAYPVARLVHPARPRTAFAP
jgi:hypothetical protein